MLTKYFFSFFRLMFFEGERSSGIRRKNPEKTPAPPSQMVVASSHVSVFPPLRRVAVAAFGWEELVVRSSETSSQVPRFCPLSLPTLPDISAPMLPGSPDHHPFPPLTLADVALRHSKVAP